MKKLGLIFCCIMALIILACDNTQTVVDTDGFFEIDGKITNAGSRSSYYGPKTPDNYTGVWSGFPTPVDWGNIGYNLVDEYVVKHSDTLYKNDTSGDGTVTKVIDSINTVTPTMVWIVGGIGSSDCKLEFPPPSGKTESDYENIKFVYDYDYHEPFLNHFDSLGIKVFLQVEAGMANMDTLIKLVMDRYSDHECVIGFGADVEWYPSQGETNSNVVASAQQIELWDSHVKTYDPSYRIFVKHWEERICGGTPVSDVIYINDAQGMSFGSLVDDFAKWADVFYPNDVGFQIGYPNDYDWWINLDNPIQAVGEAIFDEIHKKRPKQNVHMYWVDFSLHYSKLGLYNTNSKIK